MQHLYDMCAKKLSWLIGVSSDNNQSPNATSSSKEDCSSSSVDLSRANPPRENTEEEVEPNNQADKNVEPGMEKNIVLNEELDEDNKEEEPLSKEILQNKNDDNEESKVLETKTNDEDEESKDADVNTYINTNEDTDKPLDAPTNAHLGSYAAYFAECDKYMEQNKINPIPSEDGESLHGYESVLETAPLVQPEIPRGGFELVEYPYPNEDVEIDPVNPHANEPSNSPADLQPASYIAHFAESNEFMQQNEINSIFTQGEESSQGSDTVLETQPIVQPELSMKGTKLPAYPNLTDLEPTTDLSLALKAGEMPRYCSYCFRWEDQPDDRYEEKDMVSDKCCMFGNIVFFRKLKPFWTQCSACGFGMPKKVVRGRRISRVKKWLCKITRREYKGYEFKQFGYEWMGEEGRNKGLSNYL